ncbi:OprO/OprP family phosphate-selective porin [Stieleria varia]|uniref:OprO/OprP family phosphate-selective porin n=1 Tax=Stieleria varia TaxID=2528005 RepID=UPI001E482D2E|nr:porin [Stieleria varia]
MKILLGMVVLSVAGGLSTRSIAQSPHPDVDVASELADLQSQIDALRHSAQAISSEDAAVFESTEPEHTIVICEPQETKPSFPNVRLTGFFQADAAWFGQDANNIATVGDVQDGADFRRARLAAVGKAWDNVGYQLEMDFAFPGRPSFMDVWLSLDDIVGNNDLRIGQFRQPMGMEGLTSVKELTFIERSLPFAFLPFRQIGAMLHGNSDDELMTWAFSGYRFPTDTFGGNVGDNGGYGMSSRVTALLMDRGNGDGILHVGGAYSFIDPANDMFQYRNQPEIFVSETGGGVPAGVPPTVPAFVDTGLIMAKNSNLFGAEIAMAKGSFYAQSEALYAAVDQTNGPTVFFPGAYMYAGYFLTGEQRQYNRSGAVFSRVDPNCNVGKDGGIGAWEIATRYSYLDLSDKNIQGGRLNNLTLGLNWYLNPHTKFQWNYIHAMLDSPGNIESNADVFALRAQVDF